MFYRYIYKITYLPTKQFYIGKRKAKENCKPEEDFAIYYFTSASSNSWIKKSLKKNRELWNIEFLACNAKTDEELAKQEIEFLAPYFNGSKCINSLCLNVSNPYFQGGIDFSGHKHAEEYKRKMSEINSAENNPFYGKTHTEETKQKLSQIAKKRKHTIEECRKQSEFMKKNNPMHNSQFRKNYYMAIRNPELTAKRKEMFKGKNNPNYGNNWTDEMKQQMSEKKKGLKAYNNGVICVMARECPEGFVLGRLKKGGINK